MIFSGQFLTRKSCKVDQTLLYVKSLVTQHCVGWFSLSICGRNQWDNVYLLKPTMKNWLFNPENKMLCSSLFRNARVVSFPSPLAEILIYYDSNENFHCASEDEESLNKQCANCGVCPPWGKRGLSTVLTATVEMEWAFQNSSSWVRVTLEWTFNLCVGSLDI